MVRYNNWGICIPHYNSLLPFLITNENVVTYLIPHIG
jgi:hypothetical protein